jgi:hypothetical protein
MAVPRRYSEVGNQGTVASTFKTALTVIASTSTRGALYFFNLGTTGTAADGVLEWRLSRFTAAGTTTAVTPVALDGADPAALLTAGSNASGEPTYTASTSLFDQGINQRATYTWIAVPGGELLVPATASNGIGVTVLSVVAPAYTGAANASVHHFE